MLSASASFTPESESSGFYDFFSLSSWGRWLSGSRNEDDAWWLPSGSLKLLNCVLISCRLLSLSCGPSDWVDGPVAFWEIYWRYLGLITVRTKLYCFINLKRASERDC
jgi:hypothetical protein